MTDTIKQMYLKSPDWFEAIDAVSLPPCTNYTAAEQRLVTEHRQEAIHEMWSLFIDDGEYLDIRITGALELPALFTQDAPVPSMAVDVPDGVYRLEFSGGFVDAWLPEFEPWATLHPPEANRDRGYNEIRVRLVCLVRDGLATVDVSRVELK